MYQNPLYYIFQQSSLVFCNEFSCMLVPYMSQVLISLQILGGGGSTKRQLISSVAHDALQSIVCLNICTFIIVSLQLVPYN
jgi:hypothetical protein